MFSRSSGSAPTGDSTQKVEALKQEFTAQLAAANAQELVNVRPIFCLRTLVLLTCLRKLQKVNEKCYSRCVTSPSGALSAKEQVRALSAVRTTAAEPALQKAISNCADRFLEAYNIARPSQDRPMTRRLMLVRQVSRTYVDRITRQRASSSAGESSYADSFLV